MYFSTYAADSEQLLQSITLAESLRTFGGQYAGAHLRVYMPKELAESSFNAVSILHKFDVAPLLSFAGSAWCVMSHRSIGCRGKSILI